MLVGLILHTADLSNPCLNFRLAKEWEKRIAEEFRWQALLEAQNGLPVSGPRNSNKSYENSYE
eukprot:8844918-Pyramimonas_sp.AAC.1